MYAERVVSHPRRLRLSDDGDVRVESKERLFFRIDPVRARDHEDVVFVEIVLSLLVDSMVDGEDVGLNFTFQERKITISELDCTAVPVFFWLRKQFFEPRSRCDGSPVTKNVPIDDRTHLRRELVEERGRHDVRLCMFELVGVGVLSCPDAAPVPCSMLREWVREERRSEV